MYIRIHAYTYIFIVIFASSQCNEIIIKLKRAPTYSTVIKS